MTSISYHRTVNDLQQLGSDLIWGTTNPFARPAWFALLEAGGMAPLVALARQGNQGVALMLHGAGGKLGPLTNWYAFTFAELRTADASEELLLTLARDLATKAHRIELTKLPDDDGTLDRLRRAFTQSGWMVFTQPCDTNHILRLNGRNYASYLAGRHGQLRTTLKRKAKKIDVAVTSIFDAADWKAYEAIYTQSWKPEEGNPDILRQFAIAESAAGRFRFALARFDGKPVAAQFWTVDGQTAFIHKLAHCESAKALSPGTTLSAALFEHVIDKDGVEIVDFGTGDDPYKRDWMEETRTRWRLTCLSPWKPRNWITILRILAAKLVRRDQHG